MSASITFEQAVELFKESYRMSSEAPNTFPHVIESSICKSIHNGMDCLDYLVDNGQTTEERGWIYEVSYP